MSVEFLRPKRNMLKKGEEAVEAMCEKAIEYINEGNIGLEDIAFTYKDIYELVWGTPETNIRASQTIKSHRKNMEELLGHDSELNCFLRENQKRELRLEFQTSKGGIKTLIRISIANGTAQQPEKLNSQHVIYNAVLLPKPYLWAKPIIQVALKPKILIEVGVTLVLSIFFVVLMLVKVQGQIGYGAAILLVSFGLILVSCYKKFSELMDFGITSIPVFMIPIKQSNAFFVLQRTTESENNKILSSVAVVYEAQCGICGDKLLISKSREFNNRFVGQCAISPKEHIFSFDHVTKIGKNIRHM